MSSLSPDGKLPPLARIEQLRKQAKDVQKAAPGTTLADAQRTVARHYGFPSWAKLKQEVDQRFLRHLIENGDPGPVEVFLRAHQRLADLPFTSGETPLHVAAEENRPEIVQLLLNAGASAGAKYANSTHTALSWAITCGSLAAAHRLVDLGVTPDLFCAAGLGRLAEVESFWSDGELRPNPSLTGSSRSDEFGALLPSPPPDAKDQVSDALYIACRNGQIEVARWLLDHGADPDWKGYAGATCLAWADFSGDDALKQLLLARGASDAVVDQPFGVRPTQFGVFVLAGWGFAYRLLERLRRDPSSVHHQGRIGTPLHAAAQGGYTKCVEILLAFGASRSTKNEAGLRAMEIAAKHGHAELAEILG